MMELDAKYARQELMDNQSDHELTEDGEARFSDNIVYKCVICGKRATDKPQFKKMKCE